MSIDFTLRNIALLFPLALGGAFVSGLCGFGASIITLPVLAMFFDLRVAVVVLMFPSILNPITLSWRLRKEIDRPVTAAMIVGGCLGIVPGALLLARVTQGYMLAGLGMLVMGVVLARILAGERQSAAFKATGLQAAGAGVIGGVLAGAYGVPGPAVVLYAHNTSWGRDAAKAACALFFVVVMAMRIPAYFMEKLVTRDLALLSLACCPFSLTGVLLGHIVSGRLRARAFETAVYLVLGASGVGILVRGIRMIHP
ncbi:MAG: sulfite exporter TauE/SafE family protein [Planctomycetota bacterium]